MAAPRNAVDRLLDSAERLSASDWNLVYTRFSANTRAFEEAAGLFRGASVDGIMREQKGLTDTEIDERGRAQVARNQRGDKIVETAYVTTQQGDESEERAKRVRWILQRTMLLVNHIDDVVRKPKRLHGARVFVRLFENLIDFPELA